MKWEYKIENHADSAEALTDIYNKLGLEGWELVSVDEGWAYFKRPIKGEIEALYKKIEDVTGFKFNMNE